MGRRCQASCSLIKSSWGPFRAQVGSHFHSFEVNSALSFERDAAYGMRLNIPASTAVLFEPGEEREVSLVPIDGARTVYGHNSKVNGPLDHHKSQPGI